ncbi:MAG: hypothetical protein QNK24_06540 [Desulfuromusa sp.]|nr:hypothetical protein [Desulfuromusa sp.]
MSFFNELKRRNVFKVGIAYAIVAWLLLQLSDMLVPALHLPEWFNSGVVFVLNVDMATIKLNSYGAEHFAWTPNFKGIRENPRYEKYLEMAGLIDYWDATHWPVWCQRFDDGRIECQ